MKLLLNGRSEPPQECNCSICEGNGLTITERYLFWPAVSVILAFVGTWIVVLLIK